VLRSCLVLWGEIPRDATCLSSTGKKDWVRDTSDQKVRKDGRKTEAGRSRARPRWKESLDTWIGRKRVLERLLRGGMGCQDKKVPNVSLTNRRNGEVE